MDDLTDSWEYAAEAWFGVGTAYRNRFHADPVHHILTSGARLWCSGSRGRTGVVNNMTYRKCRACAGLAADMMREESGG